jgi:hypothetical protein
MRLSVATLSNTGMGEGSTSRRRQPALCAIERASSCRIRTHPLWTKLRRPLCHVRDARFAHGKGAVWGAVTRTSARRPDQRPERHRLGRRLRSCSLQEPQIERREHQDNPDVYHQALPEPMPEDQDVHADHDGYQREHVKHDACLPSHRSTLLLEDRVAATDHAAGRQRCRAFHTQRHRRNSSRPPANRRCRKLHRPRVRRLRSRLMANAAGAAGLRT